MISTYKQLDDYICADLYRYMTSTSFKAFVRAWFIPGFRFTFWLRYCQYVSRNKKGPLFVLSFFILRHYQFKYGISIHYSTEIGKGLYIGHFGGIVVNPAAIIGENVNLSPGVLLGSSLNKEQHKFEYPCVGNRVFLGNGCKLIGGVSIGEDAMIGVGTIVTKGVPAKAVVVGNPAKIVSYKGSSSFVGSYL